MPVLKEEGRSTIIGEWEKPNNIHKSAGKHLPTTSVTHHQCRACLQRLTTNYTSAYHLHEAVTWSGAISLSTRSWLMAPGPPLQREPLFLPVPTDTHGAYRMPSPSVLLQPAGPRVLFLAQLLQELSVGRVVPPPASKGS